MIRSIRRVPSRPMARHSGQRQLRTGRLARFEKWQIGHVCRNAGVRSERGVFRPHRKRLGRASKPAASTSRAHSTPCGLAAAPCRLRTTMCAASWHTISRCLLVSRFAEARLSSMMFSRTSHLPAVAVKRGFTLTATSESKVSRHSRPKPPRKLRKLRNNAGDRYRGLRRLVGKVSQHIIVAKAG